MNEWLELRIWLGSYRYATCFPQTSSPRYSSSSEATLSPTHTDDMSVSERHPSPWHPFLALGYKAISMSVRGESRIALRAHPNCICFFRPEQTGPALAI
jgi:hypothetical protein